MTLTSAALLTTLIALTPQSATAQHKNIVETAAAAGQFKTLIAAAQAAGLAGVLASRRNLTVFAPTDAAFAKLGKAAIADLLKPRNRATLRRILLYHVLGRRILAAQIPAGRTHVRTLAGPAIAVRKSHGRVRINRSNVVATDIRASNGVIHVIDRVLIPR
ncbi:MAG: fasciclin domain-containing protein [Hyphomicrobiaceae bacterium]